MQYMLHCMHIIVIPLAWSILSGVHTMFMSDVLKDRKVCVGRLLCASLVMAKSVSVSSCAAACRKP